MKKYKSFFILTTLLLNLFNFSLNLQGGESDFNGITIAKGFKGTDIHNPCLTQKFTADPGLLEYNGRVYVYGTNDGYLQQNAPAQNVYGKINTINVMSSADLVNWSDHGTINVAGTDGVAKWAGNSWAPTACHKTIDGKERFFLYFANNANGIGVLTSDSPTGPWTDPLGKALITRQTPNSNVEWLFDPAVLIDDDGTGYLYYGGGVPSGQQASPNTIRAVKLGGDMISLAGEPVAINAPWVFEDSGINKVGDTYYYSYCTNWSGGPYGNARIAYMTSTNPLGPYTFQSTIFNNPGDFFGTVGNNHHTIIKFKNNFYIFYHAEWLNKEVYGSMLGYRTTHVNLMNFSNGQFVNSKGNLQGVAQLENFNPYQKNGFNTMAWQGGVNVYGLGDTSVAYNRGDWTGISNVDFGQGPKSISINAGSKSGSTIRISVDSPTGPVIGYVTIPSTGDNWTFTDVTAEISGVNGIKNLFFVASDDVLLNSYQFSQ